MNITIIGLGYVGLSNAVLLAQYHKVIGYDIMKEKVELINRGISPIKDNGIVELLESGKVDLHATTDKEEAYVNAQYIIIATPTNFDFDSRALDVSSILTVLEDIKEYAPKAVVIIKSTVPIGFIKSIQKKYPQAIFSPEFLREGSALYDNQYPSRIVIGEVSERAKKYAELMQQAAIKKDVPVVYTGSSEAEAIKLFSNTYLALRVVFFNELDMLAESNDMDARQIIKGISLDPRIGDYYNNPSFGYGGYCLPKDSKQLMSCYENLPNKIIDAIIQSNDMRKEYIAGRILERKPKTVGIYRLAMKLYSDNLRDSAVLGVIKKIKETGVKVIIYEPLISDSVYEGMQVVDNLDVFKQKCDLIVANRYSEEIEDISEKVYTRDLFSKN